MKLTPRQRDVVALLDAGLTCPQIAERLGIAERTVRRHVEIIDEAMRKAGMWDPDSVPLKRIRKHASDILAADFRRVFLEGLREREDSTGYLTGDGVRSVG